MDKGLLVVRAILGKKVRSEGEEATARAVNAAMNATAEWRASKEPQAIGIMQSTEKMSFAGKKGSVL